MQKADTSPTVYSSVSAHRQELMGFSALLILLFHEWTPVFPDVRILSGTEQYLKLTFFFGVDIFFFLSGMGLYHSMKKDPDPLRFWRRRFGRIFLPYAVMAYLIGYQNGWSLSELLKALCGYRFYTESIYTLLWFTPAIATVYLVFPLYYRLLRRSGNPTLFTAIVMALWLGLTFALRNTLRYDLFGFTSRLPMVILGTYFGWHGTNRPTPFRRWMCIPLLLMLLAGGYLSYLRLFRGALLLIPHSSFFLPNLLLGLSACLLLACLLERLHTRGWFLGFFGRISFELYCVQEWLGSLLMPLLRPRFAPVLINLIRFAAIIAAALVLYLANTGVTRLRQAPAAPSKAQS